jgi:Helix-turn-helix domain
MLDLLTEHDVAKQLHVSVASLRRWRLLHRGPQFHKVGALVRYRPEDVEAWIAGQPTGGVNTQHRESRLEATRRSA